MYTGIILTNTFKLASKWLCFRNEERNNLINDFIKKQNISYQEAQVVVLNTIQNLFHSIIYKYIEKSKEYINWYLADLSDPMYSDLILHDWKTCSQILSEYVHGLGIENSITPLFIIGGTEIIPMPKALNPTSYHGKEYLDSDMLYCYNNINEHDYSNIIRQRPRFVVGRLPFTEVHEPDFLEEYLNKCHEFTPNGIPSRGAIMTTADCWVAASKEMIKDIPTVALSNSVPSDNSHRMIVSPDLNLTEENNKEWNNYVKELCKSDFYIFNLHGCNKDYAPYFYGSHKEIAFRPAILNKICPTILNTVACYGGKYIDLSINESMLLKAMSKGTMLYTGACDIALGDNGSGDAKCSELMMKLYNIYLHMGIPAGKALLKAKHNYYNTCHTEEGDSDAMYTILEFNLFGCPILSMSPKLNEKYQPMLRNQPVIEQNIAGYRPTKTTSVYEQAQSSSYSATDILSYVRGLVDNNLQYIRQKVEKEVYARLGLGADKLQQISKVSLDDKQTGYLFSYKQEFEDFDSFYYVRTDNDGKIANILQTK